MKFFMVLYENCQTAGLSSLPMSQPQTQYIYTQIFQCLWTVALALCSCKVLQKSIYFILSENVVIKES